MRAHVEKNDAIMHFLQASKSDEEQPMIAESLLAFRPGTVADVCVIGCGPAGLALSSELAKQGLSVCLIGNH